MDREGGTREEAVVRKFPAFPRFPIPRCATHRSWPCRGKARSRARARGRSTIDTSSTTTASWGSGSSGRYANAPGPLPPRAPPPLLPAAALPRGEKPSRRCSVVPSCVPPTAWPRVLAARAVGAASAISPRPGHREGVRERVCASNLPCLARTELAPRLRDEPHRGGLAHSRPAGEHGHGAGRRHPHRVDLLLRQPQRLGARRGASQHAADGSLHHGGGEGETAQGVAAPRRQRHEATRCILLRLRHLAQEPGGGSVPALASPDAQGAVRCQAVERAPHRSRALAPPRRGHDRLRRLLHAAHDALHLAARGGGAVRSEGKASGRDSAACHPSPPLGTRTAASPARPGSSALPSAPPLAARARTRPARAAGPTAPRPAAGPPRPRPAR